ncbi:HDOD domain-containing protein [Massilia forsythiae]|uniref:HDOD domain-containing protein n=1 Tax=Massilia forsythiae TaxID=2728020 RepID=A0A7Z2VZV5_9BURK|nr:HDOD domain-containing protein [Massilia forsythiae]QJE01927.1 HDOD domain-containing protein [Massilia forsythiae]
MKKWLNRLIGGTDGGAPASTAPAPVADTAAAAPADTGVDLAWYRWLTASGEPDTGGGDGAVLLERLHALARDPAGAAGLVPRVPEVVPQLLHSLADEGASTADLARQVAQDVVLVAEVIREANSAYYRPITPVKNAEAAIVMLGENGLRMLLARIAFRPVINMPADRFVRHAIPRVWDQSVKCALAASLMAPGLSTGVFECYLAGLMQNLGLVIGLRLAGQLRSEGLLPGAPGFAPAFVPALLDASRQLSAAIALHWDFPRDVAEAIAAAGQPGAAHLAQALAQGDRIAKLRMLVDAHVLGENDALVSDGLSSFQRRCFGKLDGLEH